MGHPQKIFTTDSNRTIRPPLFDLDEWREIVRTLQLSPRQAKIVELLLEGKRDKQIAVAVGSSVRTVREHMSRMFIRLQVADRLELVLLVFATFRHSKDISI